MADISVFITSDQTSSERRISPSWTITELKFKLETVTGIPPSSQTLQVYPSATASFPSPATQNINEDSTTVADLGISSYGRIHIHDSRPPTARGNFNDVSEVEKYEMSETDYEKRNDTVLAWKKQNHLGRFGNSGQPVMQSKESADAELKERKIAVGRRCRLISAASGDTQERRGEVKFVGEVPEIKGSQLYWVGVELDEPLGKNDGTIQGKRYFQAKANHGSLVKPCSVEVGDFPEIDIFADDDEEEL